MKTVDYDRKPLFRKDYLDEFKERLRKSQQAAFAAGDKRAAAEYELQVAISPTRLRQPGVTGLYHGGMEEKRRSGDIWFAAKRANAIDPTWREIQASVKIWEISRQVEWRNAYGSNDPFL